jgi:hypothetical protein
LVSTPKPTPDIEFTAQGGETLNAPTSVFPQPYSVYPVVTLTPSGGSATKGVRQKKKRKKKGRKKRKRKGGKRGRPKLGKGGIKWPKYGGIKWPQYQGIKFPHEGTSPFSIPGAKGRKPPKGRHKKKKKKKGKKGRKGKKGGKKGKKGTPMVELTRQGGFTSGQKNANTSLGEARRLSTPGTKFAVESGLFRHTRQKRGKRERFRMGFRKTAKFGGRERFKFRVALKQKRKRA